MNRRLTLTTGLALATLSLLYLGGSAYRARTLFKVNTPGDLHGFTLGQVDAPENIVVFTDYRCPHCRAFENEVMPELEPLVASGALSLTVVPIGILGEDSELTAAAARCAARQGEAAFARAHKALFELPGVNPEALVELAGKQGLESQQLRRCLERGSTAEEVEHNTQRAREIGIRGTPTVVLQGIAYANPDWKPSKASFVKDAKVTLSLDLTNPQRLELFPLLFAFDYVGTEVARALRVGNMANVVSLQAPLNELRGKLERRGVLGHFIKLKGLETQQLLEQAEQTKGD